MIYRKGREMRVFISGAITGTDDYMERFAAAEEALTAKGYTVLNPAKVIAQVPFELDWYTCMNITMEMLGECNAIYMLKDWEESKGAREEHFYAEKIELEIMYE